jgi:hypothetical protein
VNTWTHAHKNWASAFLEALFLCFSIRAFVLFSWSSHVFMCVHALYVHMHTSLLACLTIFCFFCFPNTLCFLDLKKNLNFSWQVQASSILCLYPFLVICITRQNSLHWLFLCKSWTWKVSMGFLGGFIPCLIFSPLVGGCDKWPQNRYVVENMAKTPTQIGQYFNDNFNMYCAIHIN